MFCKSCGKEIADNATVCPYCGAVANQPSAPAQQSYAPPPAPVEKNTMATVGLILAFVAPLIGLILSIIGLKKSKELGGEGRSLSIAGIVISCIEMAAIVLFVVVYVVIIVAAVGSVAGAL